MADKKDNLDNVQAGDYPLTVSVKMDETGQEVHRTQLGQGDAVDPDNLVSPDLAARYPGKRTVTVTDAQGKTRFEEKSES